MAQKIKFSFIKMFFQLFSFLADKTNGWKIFVQPKLVLGTMILGFGMAACNSTEKKSQVIDCYVMVDDTDTIKTEVTDTLVNDTSKNVLVPPEVLILCYDVAMCYIVTPPDTTEKTIEINPDSVYSIVEIKAQFPGGLEELHKWLKDNINYPIVAVENGIQGKVFVNFIVRSDGRIDGVRIARGVHPLLDREAERLVKSMPRWEVGSRNEIPVSSYYYFTHYF